jgi:hypothetical protein
LPRSLDKALTALGLPVKKDKEGQRLVRSLSRPDRKTGAYPELTPAIAERVAEYNRIDIVALEAMRGQGLGRLSAAEQTVSGLRHARRRSLRRCLSTDDPRRTAVPDLRVAQRKIAALPQRPD